jgi:hypothetical protein
MESNAVTPHNKAQCGLWLVEQAIIELLTQHDDWMSRPDIARALDIESSYGEGHGGFLSGGICESLAQPDRGILERKGGGGPGLKTYYRIAKAASATSGSN